MKPKPYEAQNTKFSEYQRSLLISYATFELLKFESRTDVIIEISRFLRHRRPGINEGVFGPGHQLFTYYTEQLFELKVANSHPFTRQAAGAM